MKRLILLIALAALLFGCIGPATQYVCPDGTTVSDPSLCPEPRPTEEPTAIPEATATPEPTATEAPVLEPTPTQAEITGCQLSLCDCNCYPEGETPEELHGLLCGMNCLQQGVAGCSLKNNTCVKVFTPAKTPAPTATNPPEPTPTPTAITECQLSLCDCACYPAGRTPEELEGKVCGINCLSMYGISGCGVENGTCVVLYPEPTPTPEPTATPTPTIAPTPTPNYCSSPEYNSLAQALLDESQACSAAREAELCGACPTCCTGGKADSEYTQSQDPDCYPCANATYGVDRARDYYGSSGIYYKVCAGCPSKIAAHNALTDYAEAHDCEIPAPMILCNDAG